MKRELFFICGCLVLSCLSGPPKVCPDLKPKQKLDLSTYGHGRWYEIARYTYYLEKQADCVIFDFDVVGNDIACTMREVTDKKEVIINATLYPDSEPGRVIFAIHDNGPNVTTIVLTTDHTNYVIFYYCSYQGPTKIATELAWILSRTPTIKPEIKAKIDKFITNTHGLDPSLLIWDHFKREDCLTDV